jgi:hypothetical protein
VLVAHMEIVILLLDRQGVRHNLLVVGQYQPVVD